MRRVGLIPQTPIEPAGIYTGYIKAEFLDIPEKPVVPVKAAKAVKAVKIDSEEVNDA